MYLQSCMFSVFSAAILAFETWIFLKIKNFVKLFIMQYTATCKIVIEFSNNRLRCIEFKTYVYFAVAFKMRCIEKSFLAVNA